MSQPHLKPYPHYQDSGIDWLGEVPAHWDIMPVKTVATCNDEVLGEDTPEDYEIEYVEISGVGAKENGRILEATTVLFAEAPSRARRRVKNGDVIVSTVRTYLRAITAINNPPENMIVSTGFAVIRPCSIYSGFLSYLFQAEFLIAEIIARSVGVSYPAINASELMRLNVPIPSFEEQTAIAEFLDRETGKIDELVAEQRRLIDLLKEKRQAVISHAVTKGLNPNASMKDSGIEWLGQIPAHWQSVPLKHLCFLLKDGTHLPPPRVEEGIPLLSVRNIIDGEFQLRGDDSMISEEDYQLLCRAYTPACDDVLLAIVGATIGKTAIVPEGIGKFHIQRSLAIFRVKQKKLVPFFLNLIFQSSQFQSLLWEQVGFSAQPGIYLGVLANFTMPVPPLNEQKVIYNEIVLRLQELSSLTSEAERAIELLQERRTALISAAVTGKIDVRQPAKVLAMAY